MRCISLLLSALTVAQVFSGCSHLTKDNLASNSDYKPAVRAHFLSRHDEAIRQLPEKEEGGFVTSVEKLWLNLINRTPDLGAAVKTGATLEDRTTLRVSREAKSYFYQEAEDGYFPAEHEAILLHILTGFTFAVEGRRDEATIEARKAAFYLQNEFASTNSFDSPALRLWLGTLWLYCGDWQQARVDFRVAAGLAREYEYLKEIADAEQPPASVALVLAGSGPQLVWTPAMNGKVIGGLQKVTFASYYQPDSFRFVPKNPNSSAIPVLVGKGISTASWYERHQERDHVIRQALDQSRYMVEAAGTVSAAGVTQIAGTALAIALISLGIVGGVGILYYVTVAGGQAAAEGGAYLALFVAGAGIIGAKKVYGATTESARKIIDRGMSPVEHYRFVRFLPDYIHLAVGKRSNEPLQFFSANGRKFEPLYELRSPDKKTDIKLFYIPGGVYKDTVSDHVSAKVKDASTSKTGAGWVFSANEVTFETAYRYCERQAVRTGKKFRLPTESELRLAISKAFGKDRLAKEFSSYETLWTKAAYVDSFTTCQHFDVATSMQINNSPCSVKRRVICGELGN